VSRESNGRVTTAHVLREVADLRGIVGGLSARMGGVERELAQQSALFRRWRDEDSRRNRRIEAHLRRHAEARARRMRRLKLWLGLIPLAGVAAAAGRWLAERWHVVSSLH